MRNKKGLFFMVLGLLLIAGALGLTIYNVIDAKKAELASEKVLPELLEEMEKTNMEDWEESINPDREMPAIEIDGYRYIGILEIDAIDLQLPIMEEWDYTRLKTAPCRYSGLTYQDNMIIAGHNYARHFSPIKNLPQGTKIRFTDTEGNIFDYVLQWIDVLEETDTKELLEGEWDLSLFTCTYGGGERYVLRCVKE